MLARALTLSGRRAGSLLAGSSFPAQPHLAAAQSACSDRWVDYAAAQCSVRLASGGNGTLTAYQGRPSLTAAARSLLVDTLDMASAFVCWWILRSSAEATCHMQRTHLLS